MRRRIVFAAVLAALLLPACLASAGEVEDLERRIRETEERIAREKKKAEEASARAKEFDAKARDARHAAEEKRKEADAQGRRADGEKRRIDSNVRAAENARKQISDIEKRVAERKKGVQNLFVYVHLWSADRHAQDVPFLVHKDGGRKSLDTVKLRRIGYQNIGILHTVLF